MHQGKALVPEQRNMLWEWAGLGAGDQRLAGRPAEGLPRAPQFGGYVWAWLLAARVTCVRPFDSLGLGSLV